MKFVKLSIFALSMGLFVASCGDNTNNEETTMDSTMITAPTPEPVAPAIDTTVAPAVDSMTADTTHAH